MGIVFEVSEDPELLAQYYQLREVCYRKELGVEDFDGSEDDADRRGHILLAHQDGICLAGARISPRDEPLSELEQFSVKPGRHCVWERLVIDPSARCLELAQAFTDQLIKASRAADFCYAVVLSSLRNARYYRMCHSNLGVDFKIHGAIERALDGTFSGLEHYVSVSQLRSVEPELIRVAPGWARGLRVPAAVTQAPLWQDAGREMQYGYQ